MSKDRLEIFNKKLAEEIILLNFSADEIYSRCFLPDHITLDYFGCAAYLNLWEANGTISSLKFFPGWEDGESFILLKARHIATIIKSLRRHISELRIMTETEIAEVIRFKNYCSEKKGFMVA